MTPALALVLGVAIAGSVAPTALNGMVRRRVDPTAVLATWGMLVGASFFTTLSALALALLPTHGPARLVVRLVHECWNAIQHGTLPRAHQITALTITTAVASISVLVCVRLARRIRRQRRTHHQQWELLRILARPEPGGIPTMWLPHPDPLAYSVAGTPAFIVATEGVRDQLSASSTAAVLEHERAHLRGRHHHLVALADALAGAMPWLPLMRHSPSLVRTAVELAADRASARVHGGMHVRAALLTMAGAEHAWRRPHSALGMADHCVAVRLHHLERPHTDPSTAARALLTCCAGFAGAVIPALTGVTVLLGIAMITCPFPIWS